MQQRGGDCRKGDLLIVLDMEDAAGGCDNQAACGQADEQQEPADVEAPGRAVRHARDSQAKDLLADLGDLGVGGVQIAVDTCAGRAAHDAHRLVVGVGVAALLAQHALLHDAARANRHVFEAGLEVGVMVGLGPVEHARVVRAGRHAEAAAGTCRSRSRHAPSRPLRQGRGARRRVEVSLAPKTTRCPRPSPHRSRRLCCELRTRPRPTSSIFPA